MKMSRPVAPIALQVPIGADALVDAGEHDVHDADAAHQQADHRDDAAAQPRVGDLLVDVLELVLLGLEGEVLDAVVGRHQDVARLLERGLQLVEAMAVGCPILSSSSASLPEVAGESAAYFSPENARELANLILRLERDDDWSISLAQRSKARGLQFCWEKTANETLSVYRDLLATT